MESNYVILHEPAQARAGQPGAVVRGRLPSAGGAAIRTVPAATPKVETDRLGSRQALNLVREKKVAAVAPVMPMKLVTPTRTADVGATATASTPWGLGAVGALSSPFDGSGIVVAVLDTGIAASHPAFAGMELERRNFTDEGDEDLHGHGTHCAGTIFGRPVGGTRIGVAPGVTKAMIGKVLGEGGGSSDQIAQAIQWAVNGGAQVISMSLGIDFPGYVEQLQREGVPVALATTLALEGYRANIMLFERLASFIAARGAMAQPTLLLAAAGNESRREQSVDFEIAVSPPAVSDGFISVAALGRTGGSFAVAPFSNTGARISAPGVDVVSAGRRGGLVSMDGTSMATPHVAGVAALWAQKLLAEGDLRGQLWMDQLVGHATKAGFASGFDPADVGAGMVQAPQQ